MPAPISTGSIAVAEGRTAALAILQQRNLMHWAMSYVEHLVCKKGVVDPVVRIDALRTNPVIGRDNSVRPNAENRSQSEKGRAANLGPPGKLLQA